MSHRQLADDSFDRFFLDLKSLIVSCNYDKERVSLLRDQLVFGIIDNETREQLMCLVALNLKKTVNICRKRESAKKLVDQMQPVAETSRNKMQVNL